MIYADNDAHMMTPRTGTFKMILNIYSFILGKISPMRLRIKGAIKNKPLTPCIMVALKHYQQIGDYATCSIVTPNDNKQLHVRQSKQLFMPAYESNDT